MKLKTYTFQNCQSTVEDFLDPETGEITGRAFVIIDPEEGEIYKFPMPIDVAKLQGQKLMGIGAVELANTNGLKREIQRQDERKGK